MVGNAVLVVILEFLPAHLVVEEKQHARVDDGLPLDGVLVIFEGNIDVGKDLQIRLPLDAGTGLSTLPRLLLQTAHILAVFKVQREAGAVAVNLRVHIFRGVLRGAKTQTVQTQRIFIDFAAVVVVFAPRVHLAENQFPVEALFLVIVIDGDAASEVLHLHRTIRKAGDNDLAAVALARFVDGVGKDFKDRMTAALDAVRTEDNGGALAHAVGAFQRDDIVVAVFFFFVCQFVGTHFLSPD